MGMIPSKLGNVVTFDEGAQLYYGIAKNKNYFDRGAYARPIPLRYLVMGYVKLTDYAPGAELTVRVFNCGGIQNNNVIVSAINLGDNLIRWTAIIASTLDLKPFYVGLYAPSSALLYGGSFPVTSFDTFSNTIEKGILIRLTRNAILWNLAVPVNVISCANPIDYYLYTVDPHNVKNTKLVFQASNNTMIGLAGAQTLFLSVDFDGVHKSGWNPGDFVLITIKTRGADNITFNYYQAAGASQQNPNGNHWRSDLGNEPYTYLGWTFYGYDALYTEMMVQSPDLLTRVTYSNNKTTDYLPANTQETLWLRGNFWQPTYPAEFEDIEIVPGQFTRLRNEWNRTRKFETDYMPGYAHEHFAHILGCDNVTIEGTDVIQREAYQMDFPNRHYGLVKGQVILTEKKSIIRNII